MLHVEQVWQSMLVVKSNSRCGCAVGPAQGAGGPVLGTGGILGIILVLLLVLVAAVDVAFCVTKQCGLVWTVRNAFCKKQDGGSISTKSPEDG